MHHLKMSVAENVVRFIGDHQNPDTAYESLQKVNQWIFENDQGLLHMEPDVRVFLENSVAPLFVSRINKISDSENNVPY